MEEFLKNNWINLAILAAQGIWGWLWWSLRKQFVSVETHTACQNMLGKRLGKAENDIAALAHQLEIVGRDVMALPTVQGINDLCVALERVRGEMQGFRAEMSGQRDFMQRTERQITLLIENELNGARG